MNQKICLSENFIINDYDGSCYDIIEIYPTKLGDALRHPNIQCNSALVRKSGNGIA